ncbi:MAG: hypothetical protein R3B51_12725 [Thermodesulfobacteriota bacterium]
MVQERATPPRGDAEGVYRILGWKSVDIIKSGGYKISALEIEEVLREHPHRRLRRRGSPRRRVGRGVSAARTRARTNYPAIPLRNGGERLAPYKVPTRYLTVKELPRNQMGKVVKPDVCALFTEEPEVHPGR